jgi:hypothetical protein
VQFIITNNKFDSVLMQCEGCEWVEGERRIDKLQKSNANRPQIIVLDFSGRE